MAQPKVLRIYLDDENLTRAESGDFNIMNKIKGAFEAHDFRVEFNRNSRAERLKSAARNGYSLFYMDEPFHDRALTIRKAYYYPFWRIENSAKRWEWDIAKSAFDPDKVDPNLAERFFAPWKRRVLPNLPDNPELTGHVFIPLQGRIQERRGFQSMSPLDMIQSVHTHERTRDIIVTLHPSETYLPEDLDALKLLVDRHPRVQLSSARMEDLLAGCDYVATQNSTVALSGFFAEKPAVLFGKIDFHHIAANVHDLGAERAIANVMNLAPDYRKYLCWLLRLTAINGGSDDAERQILDAVRRHGWTV